MIGAPHIAGQGRRRTRGQGSDKAQSFGKTSTKEI